MPNLQHAVAFSENRRVELHLSWITGGNQVDIAIYIHEVQPLQRIIRQTPQPAPPGIDYYYLYGDVPGGEVPVVHTEYFSYSVRGSLPIYVEADIQPKSSQTKANAVAL